MQKPAATPTAEDPLFTRIREFLQAPITKESGWKVQDDKSVKDNKDGEVKISKHVILYRRDHPDKKITVPQWMVVVDLPLSVEKAEPLINDVKYRRRWDTFLASFDDLGENLIQFTTTPIKVMGYTLISPRYSLERRLKKTLSDGSHLTATESSEDARYATPANTVRSWAYGNGVLITPNATGCTVRMLACTDPRGGMWRWAANSGTAKVMSTMMTFWLAEAEKIKEGKA